MYVFMSIIISILFPTSLESIFMYVRKIFLSVSISLYFMYVYMYVCGQVYSRLRDKEDYVEFLDLVEDLAAWFDIRDYYVSRDNSVAIGNPNLIGESCFSINPNGRLF